MNESKALKTRLRAFVKARDWEQFHSPKNLAMALSVEVAELVEKFQWLTEAQSGTLSRKDMREVSKELADIYIYLELLSDKLGVDLLAEAKKKLRKNERKYPVKLARGRAIKAKDLKRERRSR